MSDFERTSETIAINAALQIVRLKGDVKFLSQDKIGYYQPTGYCFLHPDKGYFAFAGDDTPYIPRGGKKALLQIMDKGGFIDFDTAVWLRPIGAYIRGGLSALSAWPPLSVAYSQSCGLPRKEVTSFASAFSI